jgi:hypothetical protein
LREKEKEREEEEVDGTIFQLLLPQIRLFQKYVD